MRKDPAVSVDDPKGDGLGGLGPMGAFSRKQLEAMRRQSAPYGKGGGGGAGGGGGGQSTHAVALPLLGSPSDALVSRRK